MDDAPLIVAVENSLSDIEDDPPRTSSLYKLELERASTLTKQKVQKTLLQVAIALDQQFGGNITFRDLVERASNHEPVDYLVGHSPRAASEVDELALRIGELSAKDRKIVRALVESLSRGSA